MFLSRWISKLADTGRKPKKSQPDMADVTWEASGKADHTHVWARVYDDGMGHEVFQCVVKGCDTTGYPV